ncbi:hypothetical protein K466DRAFT_86239 [Polyporus arcularius HHB13444]|uniref:Uncharacterized protein n=1 Tax=Polyporus arcularius HHB13444 TaxID=1314778 RepID=A0A5C3PPZ0_9APHY|nr:hypothetical protein K466DRAFT_86239 [Polyporus arcularius HHB13444]
MLVALVEWTLPATHTCCHCAVVKASDINPCHSSMARRIAMRAFSTTARQYRLSLYPPSPAIFAHASGWHRFMSPACPSSSRLRTSSTISVTLSAPQTSYPSILPPRFAGTISALMLNKSHMCRSRCERARFTPVVSPPFPGIAARPWGMGSRSLLHVQ